MTNGNGRYLYAGQISGVSARFHRLDDQQNLNHVIPVQGASAIPMTGGRSNHRVGPYRYDVDAPRKRCLLQLDAVETFAEGREASGTYETEISADVTNFHIVEKLHCDTLHLHMMSSHHGSDRAVTTTGNRIEGLRLGDIQVALTIDEGPLVNSATIEQFLAWHKAHGLDPGTCGPYRVSSIVRDIQLIGDGPERQNMTVQGNTITWIGFGKVILGEIHVKGHSRRLSLVRLEMGSDAGGTGVAPDGSGNGSTTTP